MKYTGIPELQSVDDREYLHGVLFLGWTEEGALQVSDTELSETTSPPAEQTNADVLSKGLSPPSRSPRIPGVEIK